MGIHTSGILIKGGKRPPVGELLKAMALPTLPSDRDLSISQALALGSGEGIAVAEIQDWLILIGSAMFMPIKDSTGKVLPMGDGLWNCEIEACLIALSQFGSSVTGFILEDASATYGFDTYKNRERTRLFLEVDGDVAINQGEPLSAEIESPEDEEVASNRILRIVESTTLLTKEINSARFVKYIWDKGA
jgi:hypothetical protein